LAKQLLAAKKQQEMNARLKLANKIINHRSVFLAEVGALRNTVQLNHLGTWGFLLLYYHWRLIIHLTSPAQIEGLAKLVTVILLNASPAIDLLPPPLP